MNRRGSGRELVVLLFFFASRGGIRGSKDRVGGVGSLDLNNSPTQWPIGGPGGRCESGQLNDKGSYEIKKKTNNQWEKPAD